MSQIKKLSAPNFLKIPWKFMSCLVCKAIFVFAVACKTLIFSHHPPGPNLFQNIRRIFISSGRRVQQRNITLSESRMCILFSEWPQQWSDGVYLDSWISCKNAKLLPKLPTFNVEISVSHNAFWVVGVILFEQLKMNNELEGLLSTITTVWMTSGSSTVTVNICADIYDQYIT